MCTFAHFHISTFAHFSPASAKYKVFTRMPLYSNLIRLSICHAITLQ